MEFLIIFDVKIVIARVQLLLEQNYKLFIKAKHSLAYKQHNYIKEILAKNIIKKDEASEDEMKFEYFQKVYFKTNIETFPCIKYEDILYNFTNKLKILIKFYLVIKSFLVFKMKCQKN